MDKQELKLKLYKAIDKVLQNTSEDMPLEDYFYHPELSEDMTEAAWLVLTATKRNQDFYKINQD